MYIYTYACFYMYVYSDGSDNDTLMKQVVGIYIYLWTYLYTCLFIFIHLYLHVYGYVYLYLCMFLYVCIFGGRDNDTIMKQVVGQFNLFVIDLRVCVYLYTLVSVYLEMYMYTYACFYMYVYLEGSDNDTLMKQVVGQFYVWSCIFIY
jgi:hypothetical protein